MTVTVLLPLACDLPLHSMLNLVWTTRQVQPPAEDDASDTQETAPTATAAPSAPKFLNVSANPKQSRDRSREEGVRTASEGQRKSERETASEEHHMKRRVALTRVRDHRKRARMCREGRWFASSWSTLLPTSGPFRSSLPLQVSSLLLPRLPLLLLTTDLTTSTSSPSLPLPMASPLRPSSSVRRHRGCAQVDVAVSRRRGVCVQVRLGLRRTHRLWLHRSDHRLPSDGSEGNPSLSLYRLPCVLNTGVLLLSLSPSSLLLSYPLHRLARLVFLSVHRSLRSLSIFLPLTSCSLRAGKAFIKGFKREREVASPYRLTRSLRYVRYSHSSLRYVRYSYNLLHYVRYSHIRHAATTPHVALPTPLLPMPGTDSSVLLPG